MKKLFQTAALLLTGCALAALRPRASPDYLLSAPARPSRPTRLNVTIPIGSGDPPTEFRIWGYGPVETVYGTFQFTARSGELCMAAAEEYGNDLFFDYDHAFWAEAGAPDKGKAAGWFRLELRADGLWAVNIRWTPAAEQAIRDKEWRYFSPALDADTTGEITRLWNIALTNLPATFDQVPLVAANVRDHRSPDVRASVSLDSLYGLLNAAIRERYREAWLFEVFNDYAVFEHLGTLWSVPYTVLGTSVTLGPDATEVIRTYTPVQGGQTMRTLLTALNLAATATEAEALQALNSRLAESASLRQQLLSATGQTEVQAALGVVAANAQAAVQLGAANVRIKELEDETRTTKLSGLIARGKADKKLTPALETWAAGQTPEALEAYLEHAPVIAQLAAPAATPPVTPGEDLGDSAPAGEPLKFNGKTWAEMDGSEKHNLHFSDKATYDRMRADHQKRTG
ncbi:phage protease [Deinococcus gobiensis]|uniref:Mu-like prophage I protein-like protein n=1 Tax=Deinococcus gobiensis (strain DSM 21396 / JCM 16679 / CGMCC 1.7299 / I-0) TaxID=745776 RepID=H8H2J3_DEIGI|nr:phage protease [Deinococcus gobiensis]AFD27740.1 Mu-like prophage I protein-like protein [Deinococcus gobiensis I-0]